MYEVGSSRQSLPQPVAVRAEKRQLKSYADQARGPADVDVRHSLGPPSRDERDWREDGKLDRRIAQEGLRELRAAEQSEGRNGMWCRVHRWWGFRTFACWLLLAASKQAAKVWNCHAGRLKARGGFFESLPRALSQSLRPSKSKHKKKNTMQDEDKGRVAILKTVIEALQKGVRAC